MKNWLALMALSFVYGALATASYHIIHGLLQVGFVWLSITVAISGSFLLEVLWGKISQVSSQLWNNHPPVSGFYLMTRDDTRYYKQGRKTYSNEEACCPAHSQFVCLHYQGGHVSGSQ